MIDYTEKQIATLIYFLKGMMCEREKEHGKAISNYTKVTEINPNCVAAYYKLGNMYRMKCQYDKAVSSYTFVIEREPDNYPPYYFRALSYFQNERYDYALTDLNKASLMISTAKHEHLYYWTLKLNHELISKFLKTLSLTEEKVLRLCFGLHDWHTTIKVDDNQNIVANNQEMIVVSESCYGIKYIIADIHYYLGQIYTLKKLYDKAIEHCNIALSINPNLTKIYFMRGRIYRTMGKQGLAEEDFKKIITLDPDSIEGQKCVLYIKILDIQQKWAVDKLIRLGKEKGFITYDDANDLLPASITSTDRIDSIIKSLGENNIDIVDPDKDDLFHRFKEINKLPI
jgi:tetratricopeptide (TPR) repeat protein